MKYKIVVGVAYSNGEWYEEDYTFNAESKILAIQEITSGYNITKDSCVRGIFLISAEEA